MLIQRLKVSGLLSFGQQGIDLSLRPLNVLIGPNGSGKSNLLEVLALLRAAPSNLPAPVKEMGGVREWLWKGQYGNSEARIEATVSYPLGRQPLRHGLAITEHGERFEVVDEYIENERAYAGKPEPYFYYRFQRGNPRLVDMQDQYRSLRRENIRPEESVLSQIRDPERYPVLTWLQNQYEQIRLYRNWNFGPNAALRREQSALGRSDFLLDGGDNLALVLSNLRSRIRNELVGALKEFYELAQDVLFQIGGGNVLLLLAEEGGREVPSARLSDGTLRYLCLLAILLHPNPPPLIAIEEPELGLHPDIIPYIAKLLVAASDRTQLIITTHSRMLIDALTDNPDSVIVCDRVNGESQFTRLSDDKLTVWLEKYTLGELWSMGEIGGNRW